MVDYVIIDKNEKPLQNIKKIKPDYFAKGFEYTSKGLPLATRAKVVSQIWRSDDLHSRRCSIFIK